MVNIIEVLQYNIRKQSQLIHQLKTESVIEQTIEKDKYVFRDGVRWVSGKIKLTKLIGQMSPKHPEWKTYLAAKRQVSLLIIARRILKFNQNSIPEINLVRNMVKAGLLISNLGKKRSSSFCISAFRYLRKLNNRLNRSPERFNDVQEWIGQLRSQEQSGD